jgi:hypothetical protein
MLQNLTVLSVSHKILSVVLRSNHDGRGDEIDILVAIMQMHMIFFIHF